MIINKEAKKLALKKDKERTIQNKREWFLITYNICPLCACTNVTTRYYVFRNYNRVQCQNCGFLAREEQIDYEC